MEIEIIDINKIKPYEKNAKLHPPEQIEQIKKSIVEFGNNDPIAIDENNIIIEGHGRYLALKELGYKEAQCIRLNHLNDEQKRAYMLAHNKLTMNTDFDFEMLEEEINSIINFDMSDFGFDDININNDITAEIIEDEVPDPPKEAKAKYGDIYQLGNHRLMCGDATKFADVEKLMNGYKADMVFTDPPYGINIVGNNGQVGASNLAINKTYSKVIADDTIDTAKISYKILKTFCDRLIIWGGNYFTQFLDFSDGWIIWDKRGDMNSNNFADGEMAYCSFHTPVRIYKQIWSGMIREGERIERVHPTQKPVKMLGQILEDFSNKNDLIIDVFGGSGSTLIACEQLGRICYMMELDPKYIDIIIDRWEKFTGDKAVKIN